MIYILQPWKLPTKIANIDLKVTQTELSQAKAYIMSQRLLSVGSFILGLLSNVVLTTKSGEINSDPAKITMRNEGQAAAVASTNFLVHDFHYLNITPLNRMSVKGFIECGMRCMARSSCLSVNVAAFTDMEQKTFVRTSTS